MYVCRLDGSAFLLTAYLQEWWIQIEPKTWAEDSTNREKTTHTTANDNDGMKQRQTGKEKKNMIYYSGSMEIANV